MAGLRYIGAGAWMPGVPKRDLTAGEVKRLGGEDALLATGLYAKAGSKQRKAGGSEDKMSSPEIEDKED